MNISPLLRIRGEVRQISDRHVPAVEALPERVADDGTRYSARDARPGYDVHDVIVDTKPGGLVSFVITPGCSEATGGWMPSVGQEVDVPVRGYTQWKGQPGRRFATNGYSLAGDAFKDEGLGSQPEGRRLAAAANS